MVLNYACECGFLDIIKKMIEIGANVNNPEYELLYSAIIGNKTEVAKCLIENGAETSDCSLFKEAILNNNLEIIKCLAESDFYFEDSFKVQVENENKEIINYLKSRNDLISEEYIYFTKRKNK